MTLPAISLTDSQIFTALRAYVLSVLPAGLECIRAQDNRVAEPIGPDFVVMTPILRERLETVVTTYQDGYPTNPSNRLDLQPTRVTIQLDVHGPNSADNVQVVFSLFRTEVATQIFAATGFDVTPLWADDPNQVPFANAEQQYEDRWICQVHLQGNISLTSPQQFFDQFGPVVMQPNVLFPGTIEAGPLDQMVLGGVALG